MFHTECGVEAHALVKSDIEARVGGDCITDRNDRVFHPGKHTK